ncbi:MAG: sodium:calcium antiporter [Pirellulaceae bacterium]|nr:MAG: sodium:calcium antiporter [Pirellulaceae bacterium]
MPSTLIVAGEIVSGFVLLVMGGELLVRGAAALAAAVRISPLVIGLTVVAFGTSAPELGVSLVSAYAGAPDLAIGNVVGSNICNVLLILGLSALICPLVVSSQLIRLDVPLMVLASLALWGFARDGQLGRIDGMILFTALLIYIVVSVRKSRNESPAIVAEFADEVPPPPQTWKGILVQLVLIGSGLVCLGLGADWLVRGSVAVARYLGVSELIIGLTIVAIGTSLPEVVTSVVASIRGQRDIAVGNVVGSNMFNIMCVLGLSAIVAPHGMPVSADALAFDIPVAVLVALVCLPIFFSWGSISRIEGLLLLAYFVVYIALLVLSETDPLWHARLTSVVLWGAFPLTGVFLVVAVWDTMRTRRGATGQPQQQTPEND